MRNDVPAQTHPVAPIRPATLGACALVRPLARPDVFYPDDGRIEFLDSLDGDHCLVHVVRSSRGGSSHSWQAWELDQARAFHRALRAGVAPLYHGRWEAAAAHTVVVGAVDVTARSRVPFQWGDGAQRVEAVDLRAGLVPAVIGGDGRAYALRVVRLTARDALPRMIHWEPL